MLVKGRWVWAYRYWFTDSLLYQYLDLIQRGLTFNDQEMFKGYLDLFVSKFYVQTQQ